MVSNLDFFPTTLAALGVTWDNDRLGIGTNLFTDTPTLLEIYGFNTFNYEISLTSYFYNDEFLQE